MEVGAWGPVESHTETPGTASPLQRFIIRIGGNLRLHFIETPYFIGGETVAH